MAFDIIYARFDGAALAQHNGVNSKSIVPRLADQRLYVASESTLYRLLREAGQLRHRRLGSGWRKNAASHAH